ncbi:DNA methyltransferase [Actinoplanes sp. NPDC051494]|uniref:DNA methyltransferase n=1 Tax=Actinoplanes sp. NPDC051494 TaxID=3363907 RepID=UPI0037AE30D6
MSNELNALVKRVEVTDPALARELRKQLEAITRRREFGLVFERHLPEAVTLANRRIAAGDKVRFLPPRGRTGVESDATWTVTRVSGAKGARVADLVDPRTREETSRAVEDLVYLADFRDPVYPGLELMERVGNGGDTPAHVVINGENFHALEALLFAHQGTVDVLYIDPPYNTGGKSSWLYNDNYVDGDDAYKHSKWLAFMERRLRLARKLLRDTGVLFVSIDDAEQHRLRMLLDQVFGEDNFVDTLAVEMSTTSGPKTVNAQQGTIVKNVEFVHIYRRSAAFDQVKHTPLLDGINLYDTHYTVWLNEDGTLGSLVEKMLADDEVAAEIDRAGLLARGSFSVTAMDRLLAVSEVARAFITGNLSRIARVDRPPVSAAGRSTAPGHWTTFEADHRTYLLTTLANGNLQSLMPLALNYRTSDDYKPRFGRTVIRGDLWKGFHQDMGNVAKEGGVAFANGKKPIRLIKQLIRWANNAPDAVILDFFGGSGTTAHAVMAMNAEDDGRRRAIVVTNNEVNEKVAAELRRKGLRPGDPEWEARGVCEDITVPRLRSVATTANIEFFRLTYQNPALIELHLAFEAVAPLLWLRAGAEGRRIDLPTGTYDVADTYAVLFDIDATRAFLAAVEKAGNLRYAFVVTDDETQYQAVASQLPAGVVPVRLYESYLRTLQINTERV